MTVERTHYKIAFRCDGRKCHEVFESDTDNWNAASSMMREEGWTASLNASDWVHHCPDCRNG